MLYICPMCRKEFKARPARQRRSKKVFCSPQCYYKSMINTKRPPEICKKISLHHSRHNLGQYLSEEHKRKISINRKNKGCGKDNALYWLNKNGDKSAHWRSGKYITARGRSFIYCPNHPHLPKNKKHIPYSRFIVEKTIGRYLISKEVIHHIDTNIRNDSPDNLYLFPNQSEHAKFHNLLRKNPNLTLISNLY